MPLVLSLRVTVPLWLRSVFCRCDVFLFRSWFAPVALLPGFFFLPSFLPRCSRGVLFLCLAKSRFLLAKILFLRLFSCYVENCSYLCIAFQERAGNAGEQPAMACKVRTTEFRACVTSVPRPYSIANTKLKIS